MFAIQSYPRSGTHLIRTALDSHPQIKCYDELLNPDSKDHVETPWHVLKLLRETKQKQVGFVEHISRGSQHPSLKGRCNDKLWIRIKQAKQSEDIIIINLYRNNLFHRFVSHFMARKTGQWGMYNPNHRLTADSVSLDPRKIKKDFLKVLFVREEARRRFPKAPWISYEELVSNCAGSMARIKKRLGVQIKPLKP